MRPEGPPSRDRKGSFLKRILEALREILRRKDKPLKWKNEILEYLNEIENNCNEILTILNSLDPRRNGHERGENLDRLSELVVSINNLKDRIHKRILQNDVTLYLSSKRKSLGESLNTLIKGILDLYLPLSNLIKSQKFSELRDVVSDLKKIVLKFKEEIENI